MKIALIGYGKMGKAIEEIAIRQGHLIVLKIDIDNQEEFTRDNLCQADVAIEFSGPHSAFAHVIKCLEYGIPVVCGSTGWLEKYEEAKKYCLEHNGSFIYSSNFSIGVNLFFEVNKKLASLMRNHPEYQIRVTEIHHTQKKDAPSGTAISLAEQILAANSLKKSWINERSEDPGILGIVSERIDPAPGTHRVKYSSPIDDLEIIHTAHSRLGFATGALLAAEFIRHKKGVFGMGEALGF